VQLPFTTAQFLDVFAQYNRAVWPAQLVLWVLGVAIVLVAWRGRGPGRRWFVAAGLTLLWGWTGAVYHLGFFAAINNAATWFGAATLLQAGLWIVWAWRTPALRSAPRPGARAALAAVLAAYAFVVYPALNVALGHHFPAMPTFGAPCPTTIATFAVLTVAAPLTPWWLWVVPAGWAGIGTTAAFALGIVEDFGLAAAALLAVVARVVDRRDANTDEQRRTVP